jgi:hypothetical protein
VRKAYRVYKVCKPHKVQLALKAQQIIQVLKAFRVYKAYKLHKVQLALRAFKAVMAPPWHRAPLVLKVCRVYKDEMDLR